MIQTCIKYQVPRLVFASSAAVYGDALKIPTPETEALNPTSPYAEQKSESERACEKAFKEHALETISLRFFNVFGPRQPVSGGYAAVIPSFILAACNSQPMNIYGDGEQTRDFVYVGDAVAALVAAMHNKNTELYSTACNIGSGSETKIMTLASCIRQETKPSIGISHKDPAPGPRRSCADIRRAEMLLGWKPTISLEQGLRYTIAYFSKNKTL